MKIKHMLIALGTTGATAGLVFGGTAVSTAFSSSTSGTVIAQGGHVTLGPSPIGNLQVSNLVPGQTSTATPHPFDVTVNTTTPTVLSVKAGAPNSYQHGSNGNNPNPAELTFHISDTLLGSTWDATYTQLESGVSLGGIPSTGGATYTDHITVTATLAGSAGNEWNGGSVNLPFTVNLQTS